MDIFLSQVKEFTQTSGDSVLHKYFKPLTKVNFLQGQHLK